MEQHPVPQHIASFQFKLFGNLTVRQFVTLAIPMTFAGIIFFSGMQPVFVRYFLAGVIGLVGFLVALVPVGGRPFDKWLVAFIKAVFAPTQRIWIKEKQLPEFLSVVTAPPSRDDRIPEEITEKGRERLVAYLKSLPKDNQSPLDVRESMAVSHLDFNVEATSSPSIPAPIVWPSEIEQRGERADEIAVNNDVDTEVISISQFAEKPKVQSVVAKTEVPAATIARMPKRVQIHTSAKPFSLHGIEDRITVSGPGRVSARPSKSGESPEPKKPEHEATKVKPRMGQMHILKRPRLHAHLASDGNFSVDNIISLMEPDRRVRFVRGVGKTRVRKLHFAPPANFDLSKLPIRGERRFEISDELKKRFNFDDDTPDVVLPNDKNTASTSVSFAPPQSSEVSQVLPKAQVNIAPKVHEERKEENLGSVKEVQLPENPEPKFSVTDTKVQKDIGKAQRAVQIMPLTSTPNVVSGLVTDGQGLPIDGAVLVIRDGNGIPVRALKTNKLGQFLSATPLSSGSYTIEVESDKATFKPASLNLAGQVVEPLGLIGEVKVN